MHEVQVDLLRWLQSRDDHEKLLTSMDLRRLAIVWADDLAVPVVASSGAALLGLLCDLLRATFQAFHRRGLPLNMAKGKTSAIVTLKGPGAPQLRNEHILCPTPGLDCSFTDDEGHHVDQWLHFVPCYKHLGTVVAASRDFDLELNQRIEIGRAHV